MSLRLFEGPAGSGKTTRLFAAAGEHVRQNPLDENQRILALTKIHGSRRRMHAMLAATFQRSTGFDCSTLNSFALGLMNRWRSLASALVGKLPSEESFQEIAEVAACLLVREAVLRWVVARYPLLIIDELQDLRGSELAVIQRLAVSLMVLCAGDDFQDLTAEGTCEGVRWARSAGEVVTLNQVRRTNVPALLSAARCIRGSGSPEQGKGFRILPAPNANVAASYIARNLAWAKRAEVAVISPAAPERSQFVKETLDRLAAKPFVKNGKSYGPYEVPWEISATDELRRSVQLLALDDPDRLIAGKEILARAADLPTPLVEWVRSRARLAGMTLFPSAIVRAQLGRAHSMVRAHGGFRRLQHLGLGVHQAKNREFERVIVLWPVTVGGGAEVQRRLLYNAVTRAKQDCLVIVQDPDPRKSRLNVAPFVLDRV